MLLDIKNSEVIEGDIFQKFAEENKLPPLKLNRDSITVTPQTKNILPEFSVNNYVVFEPNQIYILGLSQDMESFKKFISGNKEK